MNEATKQFFIKYYLERAHSEDYINWSIACLEDGSDSKNLRVLAAMSSPLYHPKLVKRFGLH